MHVHLTFAAISGLLLFGARAGAQEAATLPLHPYRATPDGQQLTMDEDSTDSDIGAAEEFALTLEPSDAAARPPRPPLLLSAGGEHQFGADIDTAGDFNVTRALAGIGTRFPLNERLGVGISAAYDVAAYDFDSAAVPGGGDPWGDIHTGRFMAVGNYIVDQHWFAFAGGVAGIGMESGADASGSWTGGGFIGGGYRASQFLSFQLGVSVASQLEDDTQVLPMFVVDWHIDEHWKLHAGALEFGVSDAVGVGLMYRVDDEWSLGGRAGYARNRFRLDDSGIAPDGVGQDERAKAALVFRWRPKPGVQASLLAGVVLGGELQVEDEDGNQLFNEDYDATPFVGAHVAWHF